ncbi:MAG: response regulator [Anaerolineae bacterium]|nr:response regulator [Anaerolineae bacterium]
MQRILVIEDTPGVLENVTDTLSMEGFEVLMANHGLLGLQLAREERPDLILCDIMMPGMDGYEVLSDLQNNSETVSIPFIFMTSKAEAQDIRRGMRLGADDYLPKPFKPEELLAAVRGRLEKQSRLSEQRLRGLSWRLVDAQERERRSIASELHGQIGQVVTGLKIVLGTARRLARSEDALRPLDEALSLVNELTERVTELSVDLRPPMLDKLGLLPALLQHFQRFTVQTQVRVNLRHSSIDQRFLPELETAAFRIVQEALSNVARHTSVMQANVQIWLDDNALSIEIQDEGGGFNLDAALSSAEAIGLYSMHERASDTRDGRSGSVCMHKARIECGGLICGIPCTIYHRSI